MNVLDGHSKIIPIIGETQYWESVYAFRKSLPPITSARSMAFLEKFFINRSKLKNAWSQLEFNQWQKKILQDDKPDWISAYLRLMELFAETSARPPKDGDYFPGTKNPKDLLYANFLLREFPHSMVINIVRDPRGVVASILNGPVGPDNLRDATVLWQYYAKLGLKLKYDLPKDRFLTIRYEDLTATPTLVSQSICHFLGLDHEDGMGRDIPHIHSSFDPSGSASIQGERATRYRKVLSPQTIRFIETLTRKEMDLLGYEKDVFKDLTLNPFQGQRWGPATRFSAKMAIKRRIDLWGLKGMMKPWMLNR